MQKIQLVNHIREGGVDYDSCLQHLSLPSAVHIICNVCYYQCDNVHKVNYSRHRSPSVSNAATSNACSRYRDAHRFVC